jgi:hypothetical protein
LFGWRSGECWTLLVECITALMIRTNSKTRGQASDHDKS